MQEIPPPHPVFVTFQATFIFSHRSKTVFHLQHILVLEQLLTDQAQTKSRPKC